MHITSKIAPCLWFDDQAEAAVGFYTSIFKNSKVLRVTRYPDSGHEVHGRPAGSVMTIEFQLAGQTFTALNGGPRIRFNEAISFQVSCDTQDEIDYFWSRLGDDGAESQCGWIQDRFGLWWQVVPSLLPALVSDVDPASSARTMEALLRMKKLDIRELQRAHAG